MPESLHQKLEAARARHKAGDLGAAAAICRDIVGETPNQPDALNMLAVIAQQTGKPALALQLLDDALRTAPAFAQAWTNRAAVLRALGRRDDALVSAQSAIQCKPDFADGWDAAGSVLREKREYEAACEHHARAVALRPGSALFQNNYAMALLKTNRVEAAFAAARTVEKIDPGLPGAALLMGAILEAAGHALPAADYYRKAAALDPADGAARTNAALAVLKTGAFEKGWELMERRYFNDARFGAIPRWQGEKTGHLLLHGEQGMGDAIHFLRYVPPVRDRAEKVTLQVYAPLQRLVAANLPGVTVIAEKDALPEADARASLMSLPYLCGTRRDNMPPPFPFRVEDTWRAPWADRVTGVGKPRIGIVWAGNPAHLNDHARSLAFGKIAPLLACANGHIMSLQKGATVPQEKNLFDAGALLGDFADTAALIGELDLVIAVDTAVLHLAASMGKPTWLLAAFDADWRWFYGREDSSWYPSLRLFRQQKPGDWQPVVETVTAELRKFLAGDPSVLRAPRWAGGWLTEHPRALAL